MARRVSGAGRRRHAIKHVVSPPPGVVDEGQQRGKKGDLDYLPPEDVLGGSEQRAGSW